MPLSEDLRPCTVCGEPVLWGTRHPICGRSVMAIEDANARVRWALSAIVKALDALGEHSNLVRLGVQALADQCGSCKGTGSDGSHGCTDCLGTGVDPQSASEVLRAPAEPNNRVDPTACPECIGMGCERCNGTGDAAGVTVAPDGQRFYGALRNAAPSEYPDAWGDLSDAWRARFTTAASAFGVSGTPGETFSGKSPMEGNKG